VLLRLLCYTSVCTLTQTLDTISHRSPCVLHGIQSSNMQLLCLHRKGAKHASVLLNMLETALSSENYISIIEPRYLSRYSDTLWAGRPAGVRFPAGARDFSLLHSIQTSCRVHPASYPMGTEEVSRGVKRPGREADHKPHLVPRSRMVELYLHSLLRLHGV
jgi:hypothetical protein